MTEKEINSAVNALVTWFESQEITPSEAESVMIKLLASVYFLKNKDDMVMLQRAINNNKDLLTIEIAGMFHA